MTRRRSKRSLATPAEQREQHVRQRTSRRRRSASVDGVFESANTCHASAMSMMPSPMSEIVMPDPQDAEVAAAQRLEQARRPIAATVRPGLSSTVGRALRAGTDR